MFKKILRYKNLSFFSAIFILAAAAISLHHHSTELINLFRLNWIFLFISLGFILTPLASIKIHSEHLQSYRFIKYFLLVFCFQASLYTISIGFSRLLGQLFPVLISPHPNIVANTTQFLFWDAGLFPWGFYSLWIAAICYFSFCLKLKSHQKIKYFLFYNTPLTRLGIRLGITFSLSIVSICFVLQLCYFLLRIKPLMVAYGPNWVTLVSVLATILLVTRRKFKSLLFRLTKYLPPAFIWLIFILCCALAFIGINTLLIGSIHMSLVMPEWFTQWKQTTDWSILWKITLASWWITVMPITALFVARISNGYSLRMIILTVLSFPILISLVLKINTQGHFFHHGMLTSSANILTLIGSIIFIYVVLISNEWARALFRGEFPKGGRVENKKYLPFLMKLRLSFFSLFYLILIYGIYFIVVPIFVAAALLLAVFLIMITIFLYVCIVDYFIKIKNRKI